MNLYFHPDIRLTASAWFEKNIPQNSTILSESGNVVNLPISNFPYNIINFNFYNFDSESQKDLDNQLQKTNYIVVPSRRIFKNYSYSYHQDLFKGRLGFQEIKQFSPSTDIFLNPENAEETWTVFDRPTIRIFKKITP